ncbi:hypothetical protein HMPREF9566_01155 [Cutibacterium acnes HL045PA1]|nr:hypothetical protein HMPREF9566_01155 [Cutibacterium acnes HL045PA1]
MPPKDHRLVKQLGSPLVRDGFPNMLGSISPGVALGRGCQPRSIPPSTSFRYHDEQSPRMSCGSPLPAPSRARTQTGRSKCTSEVVSPTSV